MKNRTLEGLKDASKKERETKVAFQDAIASEKKKIEELKKNYESMRAGGSPAEMVELQLEIGDAENRIAKLEKSMNEIKPIYTNADVSAAAIERCQDYKKEVSGLVKNYQKARKELAKAYVALVKKETVLVNDLTEIRKYYDNEGEDAASAMPVVKLEYPKIKRAEQFDSEFKEQYEKGELKEDLLYCSVHISNGILLARE